MNLNYTAIKEHCLTFSKGFDGAEDLIMEWAREKPSLKKTIKEILANTTGNRYPEGYGEASAATYILSLALTDPKVITFILEKYAPLLTTKAKQALTYWNEHPAFWCFFAVREVLKDNFLQVEDLESGDEHLLYSPGISGMQKDVKTRGMHYLCLMLPNGQCLQTAGMVRYNALSYADIFFYSWLFDPLASLQAVINAHYPKFFRLDEISTLPRVMHRGYHVQFVWENFTLPEFDTIRLGGVWETKRLGNQRGYLLEEPGSSMLEEPHGDLLESDFPLMGPGIYRDEGTGEMGIGTNTAVAYALFASLLNKAYPNLNLSDEPTVAISMSLYSLLERMDLELPWSKFKKIREYKEESEGSKEADRAVAKVNTFLKHYMATQNSGKSFDLEAIAKQTGMDLEHAQKVIEAVESTYAKNATTFNVAPEDKAFEMGGWPVPPPSLRRFFADELYNSKVFTLHDGPSHRHQFEILTNGSFTDKIEEDGLLGFVEDMFLDNLDYNLSFTLINSFFWILYYKGRQALPLRSYAIEMLKLFPYPITQTYVEPKDFIMDFSSFTKRILCTHGICSLSSRPTSLEIIRGTYKIQATDAFYSFLEPSST